MNFWERAALQFSVADIEQATGAVRIGPTGTLPCGFQGVSMDSRTVRDGELFVAIRGRRFDGHDFVAEAFSKGASAAIVERTPSSPFTLFQVPDTLTALGDLARFHRGRFRLGVAAITGSCGKTTAKAMLAHTLSRSRSVLATPGTQNNRIGVPLALLRLRADHSVAVLEFGTNRWGEIRALTEIARPTVGVVLNVGPAHLEMFGDLRGVLRAKGELWEAMDRGAPLVLNGDDPLLVEASSRLCRRIAWFGLEGRSDLKSDRVELRSRSSCCRLGGRVELEVPLPGRHNLLNALAALTCAQLLGESLSSTAAALKTLPVVPGRVAVEERSGVVWIDDTYNANPASLEAALEVWGRLPSLGRRVVAIGDMLELGEQAERLHAEAGVRIAQRRPDLVVAVGPLARLLLSAAWKSGLAAGAGHAFESGEAAGEFLAGWVRSGDVVLVKGSRAVRMERVLEVQSQGAACSTTSSIR